MALTYNVRSAVELDFLEANQIVAALEQRARTLRGHIDNGVRDDSLDRAILQTLRAEDAIRRAFRIPTEPELDALHEATHAELDELAATGGLVDFPLALVFDPAEGSPDPVLDTYWNRGA